MRLNLLRIALNIWDAVRAGPRPDVAALRRLIRVQPAQGDGFPRVVLIQNGGVEGRWRSPHDGSDGFNILLDNLHRDDLIHPALRFVEGIINYAISRSPMSPRIVFDDEGRRLVLRLQPNNLLCALWFQFARSLVDDNVATTRVKFGGVRWYKRPSKSFRSDGTNGEGLGGGSCASISRPRWPWSGPCCPKASRCIREVVVWRSSPSLLRTRSLRPRLCDSCGEGARPTAACGLLCGCLWMGRTVWPV